MNQITTTSSAATTIYNWYQDIEPTGFKEFDAHLGWNSKGAVHLEKYGSLICSQCCQSGVNFKICQLEYDRLKEIIKTTN